MTDGLYARIRSPIDLVAELFLAGLALVLHSWLPAALLLAGIPLHTLRARKESALLEASFGDQYRLYKARTLF